MLPRSISLIAGSSVFILPIAFYYFYRKRLTVAGTDESAVVSTETKAASSEHFTFNKENLTPKTADTLNNLLSIPDLETRLRTLSMIQQASAFASNYNVIRESNCLDSMLTMLENEGDSSSLKRQNLYILQILTNLVCDIPCLEIIKDHLKKIISIAFSLEYSDQACAALQVLCNVALTSMGCRFLDNDLPQLFAMLETTDPYMLRQVFSVLVNLSCDSASCDLILNSEVPDHLVHKISECLSPSAQPLVSLQLVNLLKNLYKAIGTIPSGGHTLSDPPSTREFLINSRVALKLRVQFFLSEPSMVDVNRDLVEQAELLLNLLSELKLQSDTF